MVAVVGVQSTLSMQSMLILGGLGPSRKIRCQEIESGGILVVLAVNQILVLLLLF